jgi:hypothetical protein
MPSRLFSIVEANAALEIIRPLVSEIQSIRSSVLKRAPEVWPAMERAAGNGGSVELSRLAVDFQRLDELVHSILSTGAEIKDLSAGLIDFRTRRGDDEVYLCWKYGEEHIRFWHEIEAGFSGRQPIEQF